LAVAIETLKELIRKALGVVVATGVEILGIDTLKTEDKKDKREVPRCTLRIGRSL
jgi:hypothetical protein